MCSEKAIAYKNIGVVLEKTVISKQNRIFVFVFRLFLNFKDALAAEHDAQTTPRPQPKLTVPAKVEVISRDPFGLNAA